MLKKMTIRNFKAIQDMTIEFTPLTVLIGGNSCGKSTVLQAIDFLSGIALRKDINEYLDDHELYINDLKSKLNDGENKPIEFVSVYEFNKGDLIIKLEWSLSIDQQNDGWVIHEKIIDLTTNDLICSYGIDDTKNTPSIMEQIKLKSSALNILSDMYSAPLYISDLEHFLNSVHNFEAFSVEKIRNENKKNLLAGIWVGVGGEDLIPFIHKMSETEKKELNSIVSDFMGHNIEIETEEVWKDKVDLWITESFNGASTSINSRHISDGLLRMIALVAIATQKETKFIIDLPITTGIVMFDEIENGINPYLTEKYIGLFRKLIKMTGQQVIVTTHSPIIVDDIDPEEIVCLWKDENGATHNKRLFDIKELQEMLEYLNPGEAWMNIRQEELLVKLDDIEAGK
jgi:predicted ATPase